MHATEKFDAAWEQAANGNKVRDGQAPATPPQFASGFEPHPPTFPAPSAGAALAAEALECGRLRAENQRLEALVRRLEEENRRLSLYASHMEGAAQTARGGWCLAYSAERAKDLLVTQLREELALSLRVGLGPAAQGG